LLNGIVLTGLSTSATSTTTSTSSWPAGGSSNSGGLAPRLTERTRGGDRVDAVGPARNNVVAPGVLAARCSFAFMFIHQTGFSFVRLCIAPGTIPKRLASARRAPQHSLRHRPAAAHATVHDSAFERISVVVLGRGARRSRSLRLVLSVARPQSQQRRRGGLCVGCRRSFTGRTPLPLFFMPFVHSSQVRP
jgi:hypothetical protein